MKILGLSGAVFHDASAALIIDGEIIAAAEEERFIREKHAKGQFPIEAAKWCLDFAGIKASEIDVVAFPYAAIDIKSPARWHFAKRYWYATERSFDAIFNGNRRFRKNKKRALELMQQLGMDLDKTQFMPVEHHIAHASSAYHLSGFEEKTAIISIDGKGEYTSTLFAYGEKGKIHKIKEFYDPDSLGGLYGAITQYLGFEMLDGEFKVMGMAPYGDANKYDLSRLLTCDGQSFQVNTNLVNTVGLRRYKKDGVGFYFSPKLIKWLGPCRIGDEIDEPYIHYAAGVQQLLEDTVLKLVQHYLGDIIAETGKICFAGGVALNVKLNQKLVALPGVKELFVQPASNDAGTSLGAATFVANQLGDQVRKMQHAYLGPIFTTEQCIAACEQHAQQPTWQKLDDTVNTAAELLAAGHPIAWFQGRMEFGPRALGNRSILGDPSVKGIAERINEQIKYREKWRPFCPSMADTVASDILQTDHPAPFMTITFDVAEHWKSSIPEVVHEDGTARAQIVSEQTNPRYYALLQALAQRNGNPVVLNTSLNRRGEPMVCSPTDALNMFYGSDLKYLFMEDVLVTKLK